MSDHINIARLKTVATILSNVKEEIVFVGGATVSLYASRPELTTIRVTNDVDVVVELISTGEYYQFQKGTFILGISARPERPHYLKVPL